MSKPGPKSAAELSAVIVDLNNRPPPPPPPNLTEKQAQVWRDVIMAQSGDRLPKAAVPIAIAYCRHVCRQDQLEEMIAITWQPQHLARDGIDPLNKLLVMSQRETKAMTACARALRLTPQSRVHPKRGGTDTPMSYYDQMRMEREQDDAG